MSDLSPNSSVAPAFVVPPRGARARSGSIELFLGPDGIADAVVEGLAVALAVIAGAAYLHRAGGHAPAWLVYAALALGAAWIGCVWARRSTRARVDWDSRGITLNMGGARVAIPWDAARRCAVRSERYRLVQIRDDEGRSIVCATGRGLPRWVRAERAWAREADYETLLDALDDVPRVPEFARPSSPLTGAPLCPSVSLAMAAVAWVAHLHRDDRALFHLTPALAGAVLFLAVLPAIAEVAQAWRRTRALSGATVIALVGNSVRSLSVRRADGTTVAAELGELVHDAFVGERGEAVRAVFSPLHDGMPYRGREAVRVTAIESCGEARARRRMLVLGMARGLLLGGSLAAVAAATGPLPRPVARSAFVRPESLSRPPPPPPRAWRHAPREPEPPPFRSIVQTGCDVDGCRPRRYLVDERGRILYACDQKAPAPCSAEYRALLAQAEREERPLPAPVVLPTSAPVRALPRSPVMPQMRCDDRRCTPVIVLQTDDGIREVVCEGENLRACRELLGHVF